MSAPIQAAPPACVDPLVCPGHPRGGARRPVAAASFGLLALAFSLTPHAQPVGNGFDVGGFRAYPWLDVLFNYESNYYRSNEDVERLGFLGPVATWETVFIPGIRLTALKGADAYNLSYNAHMGLVSASADDNFLDHRAAANANWDLGLRHRLRADYEFLHWHDRRGSGDPVDSSRPNFSDSPDEWQSNRVFLEYSYGALGARGRLDLRTGMLFRRYLNNNQEIRDNNRTILGGTFYAGVLPKVSLLLDVGWEGIDYTREPDAVTTLDSDEMRVYGGVTWDATAKTSGTVRLGWLGKAFDAGEREDYSDLGWQVDLQWRPRTYSTLNLTTARQPAESSSGLSDAVVVSYVDLDWIHYWRQFLRSELGVYATEDDYYGTPRQDNRYALTGGVFYQVRRWLEVGAEYRFETRDSNEPLAEYDNNVFSLSIRTAY
jgi:hypothetical protein